MTLEECNQELGGSYTEVLSRMMSPKLVTRFLGKFLDDPSHQMLCDAMMAGDRAEAFRAAHTLKGVCQNLSFGGMLTSVEPLTEMLRFAPEEMPEGAKELFAQVSQDYDKTVSVIKEFLQQ